MMTKDERAQAVEQLGVLADRVAQERRMCSDCESWDHCDRDGCALLHKVALSIAAKPADVEPVRHGHWVPIGEREIFRFYGAFDVPQSETKMEYSCSTEGCWIQTTYQHPFCPGCGAKMDGGDEANENRKSD